MNIENVEEHLLELPFYRVHSGLVHFMNFGVLKTIFQEPPRTQMALRSPKLGRCLQVIRGAERVGFCLSK